MSLRKFWHLANVNEVKPRCQSIIISWNNERCCKRAPLCRPVWRRANDLSSKLDVSDFRRQMRALISQQVAISQGLRESPSSRRVASVFSRLALFADPLTKGTGRTRGADLPSRLRQWVDPARQHGQPAALLPSGNHKPAAFSSSTKTHEQRVPLAYRITCTAYMHTWRRRRDSPKEGGGGRRWTRHRNTIRRKIKMED